ncbi:hypothetical protein FT663_03555 [Candidozyma haemuli var. vulneris]|nr:hypothetical protein FT662_03337 [[Candida] haemuloni var. vulneris]KAF3989611.1 hypothetical protein FT663_03555 [[Candida] haemuloni var. vulneris]
MDELGVLLSELLLLVPEEKLHKSETPELASVSRAIQEIVGGRSASWVHEQFGQIIQLPEVKDVLSSFGSESLKEATFKFVDAISASQNESNSVLHLQLLAIGTLQTFIQANYTGPEIGFNARDVLLPQLDETLVQTEAVKLLSIEGKSAYDLMSEPFLLVLALVIFEKLMGLSEASLIGKNPNVTLETISEATGAAVKELGTSPTVSSLAWWRARALQVQLSVLSEPADSLASVTSILLQQPIVNWLVPSGQTDLELQKFVQLIYLLESARNGIHAQTEHLAEPILRKAAQVSQLQFALTGAKAKRTKFQTFHTASLILLAKSAESQVFGDSGNEAPESFELNSDLLLEKPEYESLADVDMKDEQAAKKIKIDFDAPTEESADQERLFPMALASKIPEQLKELDPNNQPPLNDLDIVQLLLRLTTVRQTSPSGNILVDEELAAVVNRIVYSSSTNSNWLVFGRALWERSVLETGKARTVERGILQMTSLVEEIGIKIKSRVLPQSETQAQSSVASRLRFIHQLPLMAQWSLDAKLAEKYMSLGVLKSAIAIYERLGMVVEAALCYAAVEEENVAEKMLQDRVASNPDDARAISILGDLKQDPSYWEKAWEIGRYPKAKASLSRHCYAQKDYAAAIEHMRQCLSVSPLSYENWFFYGCMGLETQSFELAAEAFTRCVALDDTNSHAWSNLASALLRLDKTKQAFSALKKALQQGDGASRSWRIYENYLTVAAKLGEWNDVLHATKELIKMRKESGGETVVDLPVIETLVQILIEEPYPNEDDPSVRLTHFQKSCIDLVCNVLPSVINHSARCWRIVSRVELWRNKPWAALECHEKAFRATSQRPELETDEKVWSEAIEACSDLVSAYESLGEMPGKHGAGDVVCKDWKYKARTAVRSLMSKGKSMWDGSEGWEQLITMRDDLKN